MPVRLPFPGRRQIVPNLARIHSRDLAGATARLTEDLLAACPALTVLATSREALGVEGELSWQVPPLSLPRAGSALTASALAASDTVKLFEQRAQLVRPSFRVTDENAAEVASVCQRLDGLPLASRMRAPRFVPIN